jgi:hypothetical protein
MSINTLDTTCPGAFCGGLAPAKCDSGLTCDYHVAQADCGAADMGGFCIGMPAVCTPQAGFGPHSTTCGGGAKCKEECDLVKQGTLFFDDATCPQ